MKKLLAFTGFSSLFVIAVFIVFYRVLMDYPAIYTTDLFDYLYDHSFAFQTGNDLVKDGIKFMSWGTDKLTEWLTSYAGIGLAIATGGLTIVVPSMLVLVGFIYAIGGEIFQAFSLLDLFWLMVGSGAGGGDFVFNPFIAHFGGGYWHL